MGTVRNCTTGFRLRLGRVTGSRWNVLSVSGPDSFYCFLLAEAGGDSFGRGVRPVPDILSDRIGQCSAAGHLEVAVGIVSAYPFPGIPEPEVAVVGRLVSEPADFVVAPYVVHSNVLAGLAA